MKALIPVEMIEKKILMIRGEKVMLDADLAEIYGVITKRLNEQVKRNSDRFPADFAFQLTSEEWESLKALNNESNRSQFATGPQKHRDPRFLPWVFTEHGAIMAATVLNGKQAVAMSVYVVILSCILKDINIYYLLTTIFTRRYYAYTTTISSRECRTCPGIA